MIRASIILAAVLASGTAGADEIVDVRSGPVYTATLTRGMSIRLTAPPIRIFHNETGETAAISWDTRRPGKWAVAPMKLCGGPDEFLIVKPRDVCKPVLAKSGPPTS